jgi:hypothetical protein
MSAAARDFQPALDKGQLRALATYMRRCRGTIDCDPPLVCTISPQGGGWRCRASECDTDLQCKSGFVCTFFQGIDVPPIRLCLVRGTRREGERCVDIYQKEEHGCQPGLICGAGICGRPCEPNDPATCPEGFVCYGRWPSPLCLPTCLQTGCPEGQRCFQMGGGYSVCGTPLGQDCDRQPCPPGETCWRRLGSGLRSKTVKMRCVVPCDRLDGGGCPAGFMCAGGDCLRLCDEQDAGSCPPGDECKRILGPDGVDAVCDLKE